VVKWATRQYGRGECLLDGERNDAVKILWCQSKLDQVVDDDVFDIFAFSVLHSSMDTGTILD